MAATNISVPRGSHSCFLILLEALQDQQFGLTQAPFKIQALYWILEHEILWGPFKSGVFVSHSPLGLPYASPL